MLFHQVKLAKPRRPHTRIIQFKFFRNARPNTRVFPQARALNAGTGGARAVAGALVEKLLA